MKFNAFNISFLLFLFLASCGKKETLSGIQTEGPQSLFEEPAVVTDKDGCLGRAGFTWSVAREECVRVFDVGRRLESLQNPMNEDFEKSMFFLVSDDGLLAEVFFPASIKGVLLKRIQTDSPWQNETYKLVFAEDIFTFYENEKPLFKGVGDIGLRVIGSDKIED
jgi:hypothetical protein